jgi:hypothetical protein
MTETRKLEEHHAVLCGGTRSFAKIRQLRPKGRLGGNDAFLLSLEARFQTIAAELDSFCCARNNSDPGDAARLEQLEAIVMRLEPIERAIMMTPADTLVGLGVKARHAAYVLSEYWEEPVDRNDWDRRTVRLLIEAVCHVAGIDGCSRPDLCKESDAIVVVTSIVFDEVADYCL